MYDICWGSPVDYLLRHVLLLGCVHAYIGRALMRLCTSALEPGLLVQDCFVEALLLLLELLDHVVIHELLLLVKYLQTVLKGHLALQVVMLTEELSVSILTAELKRRDVDALKALLEASKGLGEG